MARTALFSWAYARHHGGTFVFRIEDTDAARDSEDSYRLLIDVMRWLRLDWDEGPEVGGPHGPYRQSQRLDVYADVAAKLRETGSAYRCYCTPAEVDERRRAAGTEPGPTGYDNHCRYLSERQVAAFGADGRVAGAPGPHARAPDHV
jgi:glutamyl-tRNA synthetase